jgi:hypothetical protein
MSYFLTPEDLKKGRKAIFRGNIVTPIDMGGDKVKIAEDGQWHHYLDLSPLTEDQLREEVILELSNLVEGKQITSMKAKGRGVQFILDDNTRVGLDCAAGSADLKLSVIDPEGKRIL